MATRTRRASLGVMTLCMLSGCGPDLGAAIVNFGLAPKQKVAAEFKLPEGAVLVLVDDDQDLVQPPLAKNMIVDALATELRKHEITEEVTTNEEIARLRQITADFDKRGAREVGQLARADTVIWLSVKQFSVPSDLDIAVNPASIAIILKVVNAKSESREEVRLWPMDREGRVVTATVSPNEIHELGTQTDVHRKLAEVLADNIARLFYEYEIEL